MEKIELGESEAAIQQKINEEKAKKKALEAAKKALDKKSADYKAQKAAIDTDIKNSNANLSSLNTKLAGTQMVNAMLESLRSRGEDRGLQLSDFSLSTDPGRDFPGSTFPTSIGNVEAFVMNKNGQPDYGGEIFINTRGPLFRGVMGATGSERNDWYVYGGTVLRHEKWHRDARTHQQRISEKLAYQEQLPVLQTFQHDFSNSSFYNGKIKTVTQRGR